MDVNGKIVAASLVSFTITMGVLRGLSLSSYFSLLASEVRGEANNSFGVRRAGQSKNVIPAALKHGLAWCKRHVNRLAHDKLNLV